MALIDADGVIIEPEPPPEPGPPPLAGPAGPGLRVILERIPGLTKKGLLAAPFLFQVPPLESFGREYAHTWADFDTLLSGQFSRRGGRQLAQITFPAMFIDWKPSWSLIQDDGWIPDPIGMSDDLRELLNSGTPFYFSAHQQPLWGRYDVLELPMKLTNLRVEERAGEVDARYLDVTFSEFRSPKLISTKRKGKGRKRGSDKLPSWVQVNENGTARDRGGHHFNAPVTLHKLALHFYGSYGKWTLIARRNGMRDFAATRSLADWARSHRGADKLTIPQAD